MRNIRGQTALILILLTAAALIFLAITLNWGRIAQSKSLLTIAADESATTLASGTASYGEMQKQTYLGNTNLQSGLDGFLLSLILVIIAIVLILCPYTAPVGAFMWALAISSIAMAAVNLVLQLTVINPMISALWNKLQQNQPAQQQFYEQGISTALQGVVTDQVNITDYFDWNTNGIFGANSTDTVSRFAAFYTDRLKMLNLPAIPQVTFFYDQLEELMNGETCGQNQTDNYTNDVPINPNCSAVGVDAFSVQPCTPTPDPPCTTPDINCINDPTNPVCQEKIPNGFQLNDACTDSNPSSPTYNPYCDPCCQPMSVPNSLYCKPSTSGGGGPSSTCTGTLVGNGAACNCNPLVLPNVALRPSYCLSTLYDANGLPQCQVNNPYNALPGGTYSLIYDPAFQEYNNNLSFLDLFGRDQQTLPAPAPPGIPEMSPNVMTSALEFPNGVYPFFWLMNQYSSEVDNINPITAALTTAQDHWCVAGSTMVGGTVPLVTYPGGTTYPAGFPDLAQLKLSYICSGQDCCVNFINTALNSNGSANSGDITITIINGPVVNMTSPLPSPSYYAVGAPVIIAATGSTTPPDLIAQGYIYTSPTDVVQATCPISPPTASGTCTFNVTFGTAGTYNYYAVATDINGVSSTSATITINVISPPTVTISTTPQPPFTAGPPAVAITASASAFEQGDALATLNIYNGTTLLNSCSSSPCNYSWTPVSGAYNLYATAIDTDGLKTNSTAITGTVP